MISPPMVAVYPDAEGLLAPGAESHTELLQLGHSGRVTLSGWLWTPGISPAAV